MKKYALSLLLVLVLVIPVFASGTLIDNSINNTATGGSATATGGAGGSVTIEKGAVQNTFKPTNVNTQGQFQGQKQGQAQTNVNDQTIAPSQTVTFKSPTQLLGTPSQGVPELNFGNGRMKDATNDIPSFALYGIRKFKGETISKVISVNANVKFKKLYQAILDDGNKAFMVSKDGSKRIRYQIIRCEAQSTFTTGGNLGGGGSVLSASGLSGGSGGGSLIPQWGSTKADDRFTIIFIEVVL